MAAEPSLEFVAAELALGLDDGALAVCPFGLDRVEPRALARQAADQQPAAITGGFDAAVVAPDPGTHLAADVPGSVVPDQRQDVDAHTADRPPGDEPQQHLLGSG